MCKWHGASNAIWVSLHEGDLNRQLFRMPSIVVIKKRKVCSGRFFHTAVARDTWPLIFLRDNPEFRSIGFQMLRCVVCAAVIDHDDLVVSESLGEHTGQCFC